MYTFGNYIHDFPKAGKAILAATIPGMLYTTYRGYKANRALSNSSSSKERKMPPVPRNYKRRLSPKLTVTGRRGISPPITPARKQQTAARAKQVRAKRQLTIIRGAPRRVIMNSGPTSSGFFKKGTRRVTAEGTYARKGVVCVVEEGGTADSFTSGNVVYIGHSTCPVDQVLRAFWIAFCKNVFMKLNICPGSTTEFLVSNNTLDVKISFRVTPNAGVTTQTFTVLPGVTSLRTLGNAMQTYFGGLDYSQLFFHRVEVLRRDLDGGALNFYTILRLNMEYMKIDMHIKSALKMQNRTVTNTADNEADDVTNVPLYGKHYEGNGTGVYYTEESLPFVCDKNTGVILSLNPTLPISLAEPPTRKLFKYAKAEGKAHIDPGQLKTSVLTYNRSFTGSQLYNICSKYPASAREYTSIGKFRLFGVERMIQNVGQSEANAIKIAYEHDLKICVAVSIPKVQMTTYDNQLSPQ